MISAIEKELSSYSVDFLCEEWKRMRKAGTPEACRDINTLFLGAIAVTYSQVQAELTFLQGLAIIEWNRRLDEITGASK